MLANAHVSRLRGGAFRRRRHSGGAKHNALTVIHVIPDSPAFKAGLSEELIISKIDGTETAGKSLAECVHLIRGKVGTKIKLQLIDMNRSKTNNVVLTRANVKPNVPGGAASPSK